MIRRAAALAVTAALTFAPAAAAQDSKADAERLFREAQSLLEKGKYGEACPKFESSFKKDRQLGTLLNLAFCHKQEGRQWFAWLEFKEAELLALEAGRKDRAEFARQRLAELEKTLPRVKLQIGSGVSLSQVFVEDRSVPDAERGSVFTVDPGERKFVFVAPGKKPATKLVTITRTDRVTKVPVPELEDAPPEPPPPPPSDEPETPKAAPPPAPEPPPEGGGSRTLGWIALGGAAVAAGVGAVTGIMTLGTGSEQSSVCPSKTCATEEARAKYVSLGDEGATTALVSTISFIGAGVLGVVGVWQLATAPSSPKKRETGVIVRPTLGLTGAGLAGTF